MKNLQKSEGERKMTCKDCKLMRKGDCFGENKICEDFAYAPTISKEEIEQWPEYGDATAFRLGTYDFYRK